MKKSAAGRVSIDVAIDAEDWRAHLENPSREARRAARMAFAASGESVRPLSILLTGDAKIRALNNAYRGKNKPTNVLSFPAPEGMGVPAGHLGDVVLAFETIEREASKSGLTFGDHAAHLVIHGVLHLLGYDHIEEREAEIMEALEIGALDRLGIGNPYAPSRKAG